MKSDCISIYPQSRWSYPQSTTIPNTLTFYIPCVPLLFVWTVLALRESTSFSTYPTPQFVECENHVKRNSKSICIVPRNQNNDHRTMNTATMAATLVARNAPTRRLSKLDQTILNMPSWTSSSGLKLEDKVSLAHSKAAFLQGIVVYVGPVHWDKRDIYVGVQLTGPSLGKGDTNGTLKGRQYFADVGKHNGVMVPLSKVHKRQESPRRMRPSDENVEDKRSIPWSYHQQKNCDNDIVDELQLIDSIFQEREAALLKRQHKKIEKRERSLSPLRRCLSRSSLSISNHSASTTTTTNTSMETSTVRYSKPDSKLCKPDMKLVENLNKNNQNYCLSDPTLPDNPICFASQAFLDMTEYDLNEVLGRNWRFLYGTDTDLSHLEAVRMAMHAGVDAKLCLITYRKSSTKFYNRFFVTALRDSKNRIKNYLVVHCEVNQALAKSINVAAGHAVPGENRLSSESSISSRQERQGGRASRRASTGVMSGVSSYIKETPTTKELQVVPWFEIPLSPNSVVETNTRARSSSVSPCRSVGRYASAPFQINDMYSAREEAAQKKHNSSPSSKTSKSKKDKDKPSSKSKQKESSKKKHEHNERKSKSKESKDEHHENRALALATKRMRRASISGGPIPIVSFSEQMSKIQNGETKKDWIDVEQGVCHRSSDYGVYSGTSKEKKAKSTKKEHRSNEHRISRRASTGFTDIEGDCGRNLQCKSSEGNDRSRSSSRSRSRSRSSSRTRERSRSSSRTKDKRTRSSSKKAKQDRHVRRSVSTGTSDLQRSLVSPELPSLLDSPNPRPRKKLSASQSAPTWSSSPMDADETDEEDLFSITSGFSSPIAKLDVKKTMSIMAPKSLPDFDVIAFNQC